jgi:hypothetical protein
MLLLFYTLAHGLQKILFTILTIQSKYNTLISIGLMKGGMKVFSQLLVSLSLSE